MTRTSDSGHRTRFWPMSLFLVILGGCDTPFVSSGGGGGKNDGTNSRTVVQTESSESAKDPKEPEKSESAPPISYVNLDPVQAQTTGSAQRRCWDDGCYWVVWCGHQICDGSWSWDFPSSGSYRLTWKGLNEKCAGSPEYEIRINGETVSNGRVPQYGSCSDCAERRGYGIFVDRDLGTFDLKQGDSLTLWAKTDFACGIDGPGAYAAHDYLRADLQ